MAEPFFNVAVYRAPSSLFFDAAISGAAIEDDSLLRMKRQRMPAIFNIDEHLDQSDWSKRTPDRFSDLEGGDSVHMSSDWQPYEGPKGGKGWKRDGEPPRYQDEKPGDGDGGTPVENAPKPSPVSMTATQRQADWKANGTAGVSFKTWFGDWENDTKNASKVIDPESGEPKETARISGGGSRVVKDGKPVVVYHGTAEGGWESFDKSKMGDPDDLLYGPGFYFTEDAGIASQYTAKHAEYGFVTKGDSFAEKAEAAGRILRVRIAEQIKNTDLPSYKKRELQGWVRAGKTDSQLGLDLSHGTRSGELEHELGVKTSDLWRTVSNAEVKSVFLNIRRPFDADEDGIYVNELSIESLRRLFPNAAKIPDDKLRAATKKTKRYSYSLLEQQLGGKREANDFLKSLGVDGVTHVGGHHMGGGVSHRVWIAFKPTQIKSTGNRGTFDPDNPNIKMSSDWQPYEGPKGGKGWKRDGEPPRYQDEKPGDGGTGSTTGVEKGPPVDEVEIFDPVTGEIFMRGSSKELRQALKEQAALDPRHGLDIRDATDLKLFVPHDKPDFRNPKKTAKPEQKPLPAPTDTSSFKTGKRAAVNVYRGKSRGGGGLMAQGAGKYWGLEPKVAELFSESGTVKARKVTLENPVVVRNDEDLKAIKQAAERATGLDFGKKGNLYSGWLLPAQSQPFTDYLISKGHDGIIVDFKEAAGGRQLVEFQVSSETLPSGIDRIESFTGDTIALRNPGRDKAAALLKRTKKARDERALESGGTGRPGRGGSDVLRGVTDGKNLWLWDAAKAVHTEGARAFGVDHLKISLAGGLLRIKSAGHLDILFDRRKSTGSFLHDGVVVSNQLATNTIGSNLPPEATLLAVRMAAAGWVPYHGKRDGWRNKKTGVIHLSDWQPYEGPLGGTGWQRGNEPPVYQDKKPGNGGAAVAEPEPEAAVPAKPVAMRFKIRGKGEWEWDGKDPEIRGPLGGSPYYTVTRLSDGRLGQLADFGEGAGWSIRLKGDPPFRRAAHGNARSPLVKKINAVKSESDRQRKGSSEGAAVARKAAMSLFDKAIETGDKLLVDPIEERDESTMKALWEKTKEISTAAYTKILDSWGTKALEHIGEVSVLEMYPDQQSLAGRFGRSATVQGVYRYSSTKGELHLTGAGIKDPEGTFTHEMTHAIDGPKSRYSSTRKWQNAWKKEIGSTKHAKVARVEVKRVYLSGNTVKRLIGKLHTEVKLGDTVFTGDGNVNTIIFIQLVRGRENELHVRYKESPDELRRFDPKMLWFTTDAEEAPESPLTDYAQTSPSEGFAEFGRGLVADEARMAKHFPKCYRLWKEWHLTRGSKIQLRMAASRMSGKIPELFTRHEKLPDGNHLDHVDDGPREQTDMTEIPEATLLAVRMAAAEWVPYHGKRDGWRNKKTGVIHLGDWQPYEGPLGGTGWQRGNEPPVYQDKKPGNGIAVAEKPGKPVARSKARVRVSHGRAAKKMSRKLGIDLADVSSIIGAPDDSDVSIIPTRTALEVTMTSGPLTAVVTVANDDGILEVYWDDIKVQRDSHGKGIGTKFLLDSARGAERAGIKRLRCFAAGRPGRPKYAGYKVWPRLGWDGDIPKHVLKILPSRFDGATRVQDLMESKEGRDWWDANGYEFTAEFDVKSGSRSRALLARYIEAREAKIGKITMGLPGETKGVDHDLSDEELEILEQAMEFNDPIRMELDPWVPYEGPREGKGWRNTRTNDIKYQVDKPGGKRKPGIAKDVKVSVTAKQHLPSISRMMGRDISQEDLAVIAGATEGSTVQVSKIPGNRYRISVNSPYYESIRILDASLKGKPVMKNDLFRVYSAYAGNGLGTKIFGKQVANAARLGIKNITCMASREENMNGYYTWVRLGYDADITRAAFVNQTGTYEKLKKAYPDAKRFSDLMKDLDSRDWWKENGDSVLLQFDTDKGSLSRRVLAKYIKEGQRRRAKVMADDSNAQIRAKYDRSVHGNYAEYFAKAKAKAMSIKARSEEPDLFHDSEGILDDIWDSISRED